MTGYTYLYGALLVVGGVAGYASARSTASLIAGAGSGAAVLLLELALRPSFPAEAAALQAVTAAVVGYVMGTRYAASGKPMPGAVAGASALFVLLRLAPWNLVGGFVKLRRS